MTETPGWIRKAGTSIAQLQDRLLLAIEGRRHRDFCPNEGLFNVLPRQENVKRPNAAERGGVGVGCERIEKASPC